MKQQYDYIITGAGCAGMSLLMRMMLDDFFLDKSILVIDAAEKNQPDRTWCFWEKQPDIFEPIVHHRWKSLDFFSPTYAGELAIAPYEYKMIQGLRFYEYVKDTVKAHANIEWLKSTVVSVETDAATGLAAVVLANRTIYATKVFNSILFKEIKPTANEYLLLQHFKGWVIKTDADCFDKDRAVFMDFRVNQQYGTTFMYVLPTSANTALVEYTLFTEALLPKDEYDHALKAYIGNELKLSSYTVEHEEFGIIPMTNAQLPKSTQSIVFIGIAGGQAKASSGYAFKFIQKRTSAIVDALNAGKPIPLKNNFSAAKAQLYDSTLLHVLHHKKMGGAEIFAAIFKHNKAADVLAFLDNESSLLTDLKIMNSVPTGIFLPAAITELKQLM
ncbi:MAG: lycopene cyclase family protein [Sediminibacterium sp.]|nr:lycopene cyclase family protein [Sediminibacterium sp.]